MFMNNKYSVVESRAKTKDLAFLRNYSEEILKTNSIWLKRKKSSHIIEICISHELTKTRNYWQRSGKGNFHVFLTGIETGKKFGSNVRN